MTAMDMEFGQSPAALEIPYPAWKMHFVQIIEKALWAGLTRLDAKQGTLQLTTAKEEQITNWLIAELNKLLTDKSVSGFSADFYQDPVRGSKLQNFDGKKIEKAPDLVFRLQRNSSGRVVMDAEQDVWICECKLIEQGHSSRNFESYQKQGIDRFICGDYAWAMPHAQMLAYVRWSSDVPSLGPELQKLTELPAAKTDDIYTSMHARSFVFPKSKTAPGNIALRHMWFRFNEATTMTAA